jgi:hypothetical protein
MATIGQIKILAGISLPINARDKTKTPTYQIIANAIIIGIIL